VRPHVTADEYLLRLFLLNGYIKLLEKRRDKLEHWVRQALRELCSSRANSEIMSVRTADRIADVVENLDYYLFQSCELEQRACDLLECTTIEEFSRTMWSAATDAGFQNYIVFVMNQGGDGAFRSRVSTSLKSSWIERYDAMSYQFIDPVLKEAEQGDGVILFNRLREFSPSVQAFWRDAEDYGVGKNGICYSMTRQNSVRIGVSFLTTHPDCRAEELISLHRSDLQFIAQQAVDTFRELSGGNYQADHSLSEKELRFLHTLAASHDPEDALDITPSFGSNRALQSSIRRKLGVVTIFQALTIAVSRGWLDELPFSVEEVQRLDPMPDYMFDDQAFLCEGQDGSTEVPVRLLNDPPASFDRRD
jgi:hypothetical protein